MAFVMGGISWAVAELCRYNPRMARLVDIHPKDPQPRLIEEVVDTIRNGGLIAYPTDSSFALGCQIGDKRATDRIRRIRQTDKGHNFTLVCTDLSEISVFAKVENWAYRLIKSLTPGPYTFILQASREVPKRLQNSRRRTIGLRIPDHVIVRGMLEALGEPIMSSTLSLPGDELPLTDVYEIDDRIGNDIDLIVEGGPTGVGQTTVVDLSEGDINILRRGLGEVNSLL